MNKHDAINALASTYVPAIYQRIAAALEKSPMTRDEMAKTIHASPASISTALQAMKAHGIIHVSKWLRADRGPFIAVLSLGPGEDAPKPKPFTQSERCLRWRGRGGDSHLSEKLRRQSEKIAAGATLAGLLGVR